MLVSAQFVGYTAHEGPSRAKHSIHNSSDVMSNAPITEVTLNQHSNNPF